MIERLNRRAALAKLGLAAAVAYTAPVAFKLSEARASSAGSSGRWSASSASGGSVSRPSGPSGRGRWDGGRTQRGRRGGSASGPSGYGRPS